MDFSSLLDTLRYQCHGISPEELEQKMKVEKEKIERLIHKAFEDGSHQFVWEGSFSWPAQRALKAAGCIFKPFFKPAPSTEFGGFIVDVYPKNFSF